MGLFAANYHELLFQLKDLLLLREERRRERERWTDRDFTKDGVQICIFLNNRHNSYTRDNIKMGKYVLLLKFYKTDRENVFRLHLFANNVCFFLLTMILTYNVNVWFQCNCKCWRKRRGLVREIQLIKVWYICLCIPYILFVVKWIINTN